MSVPYGAVAATATSQTLDVPWFLDLREIFLVLRLRRRWIIGSLLAALATAVFVLPLLPPKYSATAKILIDPQGLQIVKNDISPPGQANEASLYLVDSQMQVLSSDDVLRKVVDKFGLDHDPEFSEAGLLSRLSGLVQGLFGVTTEAASSPTLNALRTLRKRLLVQRAERSFALTDEVTTYNREKSARLAQGIAEAYLAYSKQSRADIAQSAGSGVASRLGDLRAQLRSAEDKAQDYRTAHGLVGTRNELVSEKQLTQNNEQLGLARARAEELHAQLEEVEKALKTGASLDTLPQALQSMTITQLRSQLANAERTRANLSSQLGPRHPAMLSAQNEVRVAQGQVTAEVKRIAASVKQQYQVAAADVARLSANLDKSKSEAGSVGEAMVRMRELDRQVDALRSVYESFLVRARELQEQHDVESTGSRIISPAIPPAQRNGPPLLALIGLLLAGGLAVGIALALAHEAVSGRIRTVRRLARQTGLDVVGVLPPFRGRGWDRRRGAFQEDRYEVAAMRLRHQLWSANPHDEGRLIVISAADRQADKSRLAVQLATLAAGDYDRVLLVDADPDDMAQNQYDLPMKNTDNRLRGFDAFTPERMIAGFPGLHYISIRSRATRQGSKSINDELMARVGQFDAVIVNAGLIGSDLFTERLAGDGRLLVILLIISASRSTFPAVENALKNSERAPVAAVLTDAYAQDL